MMKYRLDTDFFRKKLLSKGYGGFSAFAQRSGLHRNTLQNLLKGESVFRVSLETLAEELETDPLELIEPVISLKVPVKGIEEIETIVARLVRADKNLSVLLIGSRLEGKAKKYSDWDVGVFRYPEPLTGREYLKLKNLVEEWSENLVRKVDLINLNEAPRWFLEGIRAKPHLLAGSAEAFHYFLGVLHGIVTTQGEIPCFDFAQHPEPVEGLSPRTPHLTGHLQDRSLRQASQSKSVSACARSLSEGSD